MGKATARVLIHNEGHERATLLPVWVHRSGTNLES